MKISTVSTNPEVIRERYTHGGAVADIITPEQELRRTVLSCLLWEDDFYESGESIASRIVKAATLVPVETVCALAIEAREKFHLRRVPLLLLTVAIGRGSGNTLIQDTISRVIQRPDELVELVSLYWRDGKRPLSAQMKKGLARAFKRFNAYSLAKYNRNTPVKLRDVLFLCHAKPKDEEQALVWKHLVDGSLQSPDTWEVGLMTGGDKKKVFERLLFENKLGYMALLRNLRNMVQAGVKEDMVKEAILARKGAEQVLPFRFFTAAKHAPEYEEYLDKAMVAQVSSMPKLPGKTIVIVDISGSMGGPLSSKSEVTRQYAACAMAAILREVCEEVSIYATAGDDGSRKHATALVPPRHGMALIEAISGSVKTLGWGGIFLKQVMDFIELNEKDIDRVVVITDEQDCANFPEDMPSNAKPLGKTRYMLNVGTSRNGISYDKWVHINGFSESALTFIAEWEEATSASK